MVASTYSQHEGLRDVYVFAYKRSGTAQTATFTPSVLGIGGQAYVFDYFSGNGALVEPGDSFSAEVGAGSYYVVAPVGPSGIAFLGDAGRYVSLGKKRVSRLRDTGRVRATVVFADGDGAIMLHGYSPVAPALRTRHGQIGDVEWDPDTRRFSFALAPDPGATRVQITIGTGPGSDDAPDFE